MYSRIIFLILLPIFGFSQAPQKINFQSILRNTNGEVVANKAVSLRISILSGSINGISVYSETYTKTSDASGLISLQIGNGMVISGVFSTILWGNAAYFIKLEADFNGGSNYVLLGTQELMSVPYALYASKTDTSVLNLTTRLATKLNISDFPLGNTTGNMQYWNGTTWVNLAPGLPGQSLIITATGIPSWSGAAFPTLTTTAISSITSISVNAGGNISSDGGASVSARGLVYGTTSNPTLSNSLLTIGSGVGGYAGTISGLTPNTTYYVRAYATNSAGTGYGNEISFQTLPVAVPTLVTTDASGITQTTVTSGGTISNDGGAVVTERGIVYSTSSNPTTTNTKVSSVSGTGSFSVNATSLTPNTTYFIRSYAINSAGTGYGNNITFQTTVPAVPSLTTRELLNITNTTATGGGSITNDGGSSITAKGICWGISPNPTTFDSKTTDGPGTTTFTSFITGLSANVTYYVRAYATNSTGTGYGNQQTFTTSSTSNTLPEVTSTSVTGLTTIQATFNAEVNSQGGGTVTERGAVWNTSGNPTVNSNRVPTGAGTGVYTATLTGLSGGSNCYVRAYAINNFGISYGVEIPFTTLFGLATLTTNNVVAQSITASSGGNINDNGGSTVTARGVVWNTSGNPTISDSKTIDGSGTGSYVSSMTSLSPSSTYYVRAYATNSNGTAYGNERTFSTNIITSTVNDGDGNVYNTISIGSQVWLRENLRATKFNNGDPISYVENNIEWTQGQVWENLSPKFSYPQFNESDRLKTGNLYNYFVVSDPRNICPIGWRTPNSSDWNYLFSYPLIQFNMTTVVDIGSVPDQNGFWLETPTGANNSSYFTIYPVGVRLLDGIYDGKGRQTVFWCKDLDGYDQRFATATGFPVTMNHGGLISYTSNFLEWRARDRRNGYSIRCIKDN